MWCVGGDGFDEQTQVEGLDIDGADLLAIAGDAAALVRRVPSTSSASIGAGSGALDDDVDADVPDGVVGGDDVDKPL